MGALIGLLSGIGLMLIWLAISQSVAPAPSTQPTQRQLSHVRGWLRRLRRYLAEAGLAHTTPAAIGATSIALALALAALLQVLTQTWPLALLAAILALALPWIWVQQRRQKLLRERAKLWPDVIDAVISGVRVGLSLSETLLQVGANAPAILRPQFAVFAAELEQTGSFTQALAALRRELADPIADRVCIALALAHEVGGADVTTLLASLAQMLRADQRTRGELEARQSWTINGARLAVVAPWIIVVLLCLNPAAAAAYSSPTGILILLSAAVISLFAYYLMLTIARLPLVERVYQ